MKPALKAAALEHGWRPADCGAFIADPSKVIPPVVVHLDPLLEGDAYGGLRFELSLRITDPEAEEFERRFAAAHPEYGPLQRS